MVTQAELQEIARQQAERVWNTADIINRELQNKLPVTPSHALIISGVRRCGKSTLMSRLVQADISNSFYLNFDTPKLYNFDINDFQILDKVIEISHKRKLFFDEIQVIHGWELYIRQKLDEGFTLLVTGSNATMLSRELGTRLTGRHISKELFPFSYNEYLDLKQLQNSIPNVVQYIQEGGFPEFLKSGNIEIHGNLLEDIIHRDIAVRYNIRDVPSLKGVLVYLISNVGTPVSATKLKQVFGVKSTNTILDYFSFIEQTYLISFIPKFSYSLKAQMINPRKTYCIDTGLIHAVSRSLTKNIGRIFENAVFLELRREYRDIYYFALNHLECDFVVFERNTCVYTIQVCHELTHENAQREYAGAVSAAKFFNLPNAFIITLKQNDRLISEAISIEVISSDRFFGTMKLGNE